MAVVTISQAAKDWRTSRTRLYALNKSGRLSFTTRPDGSPGIDTAELARVLGEPETGQELSPRQTPADAVLSAQVESLTAQLEETRRERDNALAQQDRLLGIVEAQTRLLAGPTTDVGKAQTGSAGVIVAGVAVVVLSLAGFLLAAWMD